MYGPSRVSLVLEHTRDALYAPRARLSRGSGGLPKACAFATQRGPCLALGVGAPRAVWRASGRHWAGLAALLKVYSFPRTADQVGHTEPVANARKSRALRTLYRGPEV